MTDLNYTVSETIYTRYGQIVEIVYEYEEVLEEQIQENMQIIREKHEIIKHQSNVMNTNV